jgi:hypothetical protein
VPVLETLSKNPVAQRAYERVLEAGFVPRRAFAHYFMNTEGIRSRVHLQNYFSTFFPDYLTEATAHVWLCDASGKVIATKDFVLPPFGQLYIEIDDIVGHDLDSEGIIYIDLEPPAVIRKQLKTIPNLRQLEENTPFWVSFRDSDDNYMYVHSIEKYRGKVFGAIWPLSRMMAKAKPERDAWQSWRLLDVALLDELQIVVINHSHTPGTTHVSVVDDDGERLWSEEVTLTTRASRRVVLPPELIEKWAAEKTTESIRVAVDPLFTGNGKPYVIMRYADGPWSLHHG